LRPVRSSVDRDWVESRCGAVAVGRTYLFPPLSSGGALVVRPWLRFHIPFIRTGHADLPHPALGRDFTPSSTARRAQTRLGVRAGSARLPSCCFMRNPE